MSALIDYWYYTGDDTWNDIVQEGLLFQVGPNKDYMPPNQTMTEGNDDQVRVTSLNVCWLTHSCCSKGFWGMAALSAAEYNFPNPNSDQPQWLALAQAVFNTQAARWDTTNCNGGLRWQIFQWNNGFNYKNSISQACFFNIAARLALYTGNKTYADWANKVWDWMIDIKFMQGSTDDAFYIYDGAHTETGCTNITPYQWTYNAGAFLLGAAAMYNYTAHGDSSINQIWRDRVDALINGTHVFFIGPQNNIMTEVACESVNLCDLDQQSFKAYLARWMAATTKWAAWTYDTIKPKLDGSATAASQQCTGGDNGRMCGLKWVNNNGQWDGTTGVGQQMAAMEIVLATMIENLNAPVTDSTGGTSPGNPNAGTRDIGRTDGYSELSLERPITMADIAGAYILTTVILVFLLSGVWLVLHDETSIWRYGERGAKLENGMVPNGMLKSWQRMDTEENGSKDKHNPETPLKSIRALDGPSTPPKGTTRPKSSPTYSASVYTTPGVRPSAITTTVDDYPDEQPWRRPAREGDYAGAIDPNRGNGAGFGIMNEPETRENDPTLSLSGSEGGSLFTGGGRDLMKMNIKLEKKPLPGKPGLGRRQPGQWVGEKKV